MGIFWVLMVFRYSVSLCLLRIGFWFVSIFCIVMVMLGKFLMVIVCISCLYGIIVLVCILLLVFMEI